MTTTSCKKPIWRVGFSRTDGMSGIRVENYAAYDLTELLSMFSETGKERIVDIEKTKEEVTYHYPSTK